MKRALAILALTLQASAALACSESWPTPAMVAASAPDAFRMLERAASVAKMRVVKAPGFTREGHGIGGTVEYRLVTALKGKPPVTVSHLRYPQPCGGVAVGAERVVFLDERGGFHHDVDPKLASALAEYAVADQAAREALIARWVRLADSVVSGAARKRQAPPYEPTPR